jgi:exopolyphosphatase/guanosine-5'-triphosphate,3'-diphosphate pyrophosphatase
MLSSHASPAESSLIGTAGTVTTLAAIAQQMEHYAPEKINNYILSRQTIENIYHRLTLSSLEERKEITGLEEGREAIIVPGAAIVLEIMNHFGFNQITVSDAGLLEGILLADCMEITDFKSL